MTLDAEKIVMDAVDVAKKATDALSKLDPTVVFSSAYNIILQVAVVEAQSASQIMPVTAIPTPPRLVKG